MYNERFSHMNKMLQNISFALKISLFLFLFSC